MQPGPHAPDRADKAPEGTTPHPVCGQVGRFLSFIVSEPSEELSAITDANKRKICEEILSDVVENAGQPDPVMAVRRRLTNYATLAAYDEALTRAPGSGGLHGATGELRARLPELAHGNPLLREFFAGRPGPPATEGQMADLLRARGIVYSLWTRAYNVARIELGDWDRDKGTDWFGAYKVAQAVYCELAYRRELGMAPTLPLAGKAIDGSGEFAAYGEFTKIILEGHRQPRPVWESRWESLLHYPCPLAGLEL